MKRQKQNDITDKSIQENSKNIKTKPIEESPALFKAYNSHNEIKQKTICETLKIVKIGNSKGVRIPKLILEQFNFGDEAELIIENDGLKIKPVQKKARAGWAEQIAEIMAKNGGHDKATLEFEYIPTKFDEEWEW